MNATSASPVATSEIDALDPTSDTVQVMPECAVASCFVSASASGTAASPVAAMYVPASGSALRTAGPLQAATAKPSTSTVANIRISRLNAAAIVRPSPYRVTPFVGVSGPA